MRLWQVSAHIALASPQAWLIVGVDDVLIHVSMVVVFGLDCFREVVGVSGK